ncbi:arsenate reductase/protein-tyrosine-phosphatase family protein [Demequina rhizosphaerae]|uniref:arsenate reductase/protein-tyrosine-phosphatase family protein n=1 Tax=Demequina rhizosphaerae TaxID=1638985 RepID=UPI000783D319|nr:hypothetical protein [Demequina rhizosphaerae]
MKRQSPPSLPSARTPDMGEVSATAFRVLLVDATNTGRSVAGERLLRKHLWARGVGRDRIRITSAGLNAEDGASMQGIARDVIEAHGGSAQGFAARSLSAAMVDASDLFIVGTGAERDELARRHPRARARSFTLAELARLYGDIDLVAPLHEHAPILERRRLERGVPDDWTLPPWEQLDERARAAGDRIAEAALGIADIWAPLAAVAALNDAAPASDASACVVDAFGVPVALHCGGAVRDELAAAGRRAWSRCLVEDAAPETRVDLMVDPDLDVLAEARARGMLAYPDVDHALHYLSSAVTVRAIEQRVGSLVMLHAAGLASPEGDVVGFVAPSGTGKTTLARTLGAHYGYVTDETLAIDAGRTVLPYPKPLSVLGAATLTKEQWGPESLDLLPVPRGRLRLTRLALVERDPTLGDVPRVEELPLLHGLAHLAEQVSYLSKLPRQLHTLADLVESVGGLVRIRYREARDLLPLMPDLLAGER